MLEPGIIVHSGAGYFPDSRNAAKIEITKAAALAGWIALSSSKSPLNAVEAAIKLMEDNVECNAGYGSVLNAAGEVEMDAMLIRGKDLATGGVGALRQIQHPISVSRRVLEVTDHCLLVGEGALEFATSQGFPLVSKESLVSPLAHAMLISVLAKNAPPSTETGCGGGVAEEEKEVGLGTVGAVAINELGELVAGTSTGGISGKMVGRVGDTPIPGGGTFCDDRVCGVSGTGKGEAIMRVCLASRIATLIGQQEDTSGAILTALKEMETKVGSDGGAIGIRAKDGLIGHAHTSRKMTWASVQGGQLRYGLIAGEEFAEPLPKDLHISTPQL